ncbi:hypothetical protein FACS1894187_03320 [Synergistales bacterium]|nr:hypothetical protein FACS1894187_03320 [Synergistales bacterium]
MFGYIVGSYDRKKGNNHMQSNFEVNFTILTIPRGFNREGEEIDETSVRQLNAIKSWLALTPKPEIILFGDDPGVAETASELGISHIPDIEKTESGAPLFNDAILKGQEYASTDVVVYVNSDIILFDDFTRAIVKCAAKRWGRYLLTGRRQDLDFEEIGVMDFSNPEWQDDLRAVALTFGKENIGMDYFVFPKGMYKDMPCFAIGRPAFDTWMTGSAIFDGIPVVDLSDDVLIVHQNHDYNHILRNGSVIARDEHPDSKNNLKAAGRVIPFGMTASSTWLLKDGKLRRRLPTKETPKNFFRSVIFHNFEYMIHEISLIKYLEYVENCPQFSVAPMPYRKINLYEYIRYEIARIKGMFFAPVLKNDAKGHSDVSREKALS